MAFAVMAATVVFDMPGKLTATAAANCSGTKDHDSRLTIWSNTDTLPTAGSYYLNCDVNLTDEIILNGNLVLCLNGHTITQTVANKHIFKVGSGHTLTLYDCRSGKLTGTKFNKGSYRDTSPVFVENGIFNMYGGSITGNEGQAGGGVYLDGGTFNMHGGSISNNSVKDYEKDIRSQGGGVYIGSGTFNMHGGTISNNKAFYTTQPNHTGGSSTGRGGGIYLNDSSCVFNFIDGTIAENTAEVYGGGIYAANRSIIKMTGGTIQSNKSGRSSSYGMGAGIYISNFVVFTMSDGKILNNIASDGLGGGVYNSYGNFTMEGGTISGNQADNGAGVQVCGTFLMTGGEIIDNTATKDYGSGLHHYSKEEVKLDGNVKISGNKTNSGINRNVCLEKENDNEYTILTIGDNFQTDSPIGISGEIPKDCSDPLTLTNAINDEVFKKFKSEYSSSDGVSFVHADDGTIRIEKPHNYDTTIYKTDDSEHWYECTVCQDKTDIAEHSWTTSVTKAATCTTAGSQTKTCQTCKKQITEQIPATGHTLTHTAAKAATCTEKGNVEYWTCGNCNLKFSDANGNTQITQTETKATGHTWGTTYDKDSTQHWKVCTVCKAADTKSPHNWNTPTIKDSTCTKEGEKRSSCKDCTFTKKETISKKPHTYSSDWSNDETNHWHECTVCHGHDKDIAHNWKAGEITKQPSCTEQGTQKYTCECGAVKTEDIPQNEDHAWGEWTMTKEPTKTEKGLKQRTCTRDNTHIETADIPVLTDNTAWNLTSKTEASCTAEGKEVYENAVFGTIEVIIPKTAHTEQTDPGVEPDCTNTGLTEGSHCSVCGETLVEQTSIPAKGHTEAVDPAEDATCTKTGLTEGKHCDVCKEVLARQETIDMLPHSWGEFEVTIEPTEEKDGEKTRTCSVCGAVETEPVAKLAHTHDWSAEWSKDETYHWYDCLKNCGETKDKADHTWDGGTVMTEATEQAAGLMELKCTVCGETKQETIPQLEHKHVWDGGKVTLSPSCTINGEMTYTCACGETRTDIIAAKGHNFSEDWQTDDASHYHDCLNGCGVKSGEAAHAWGEGITTKQPTATTPGEMTYECTVCKKLKTKEIPVTAPDDGSISAEVQPGDNAPKTEIDTPEEELIKAVLKPEEQDIVKSGVNVKIILTVEDATLTAPPADKAKVETAISGIADCKLGQYLDVNMLKVIGGAQEKVTETRSPITVTFEIPAALRGSDRAYSVIRVHDGVTDVLRDGDSDPDTVTIETDKFSTYALVYNEKESVSESGAHSPAPPIHHRPSGWYDSETDETDETSTANETAESAESAETAESVSPSETGEAAAAGETVTSSETGEAATGETVTSSETDETAAPGENTTNETAESVPSAEESDPSESESETEDGVTSESGGETQDGTLPSGETFPAGSAGSGAAPSTDESGSASTEDVSTAGGENPTTGIAAAMIPLAAVAAIMTVTGRRKKK